MKKITLTFSLAIISIIACFSQAAYPQPGWINDNGGYGPQDSHWKDTYITSATTTGGSVNLNYTATTRPSNFWYVHPTTAIEVESDGALTLNLTAFSLGAYNETDVLQDLRFTCAYIYADFDGNKTFEVSKPRIGNAPPTHYKGGNMDVMNISTQFSIPVVTSEVTGRIRVVYDNAWHTFDSGTWIIKEGLVYDFDVKIKPKGSSGINNIGEDLIKIIPGSKKLSVSAPVNSTCAIYTLSGALVASTQLQNSVKDFELSQGLYIVKIANQYGNFAKKAMVKN